MKQLTLTMEKDGRTMLIRTDTDSAQSLIGAINCYEAAKNNGWYCTDAKVEDVKEEQDKSKEG